jgi:preprotein translocase subunit SecD
VAAADQDRVVTELISSSGQVYLRPVLVDNRFGIPCVAGPDRSAPPSDSTSATTTVAGATPLPDVPPEASGYLMARGGDVCNVGPAGGTGDVFSNAQATLVDGGSDWGVTATLKTGPEGEGVWNTLAAECFNGDAACPTHQLAIELDGLVIAAPSVQLPEFHGDVQISGSFTEAEASNLAEILNRGALPVKFEIQARSYLPG